MADQVARPDPRKATVGYQDPPSPRDTLTDHPRFPATSELLREAGPPAQFGATLAAGPVFSGPAQASVGGIPLQAATVNPARTTVLPRAKVTGDGPQWDVDGRPRYEPMRPLGTGGVGEVVLVHDHDIERKVAVKRLRSDQRDPATILRFAEEIKTIGRLEHPSIVPIHDVGIDEGGQHYFVMKYVEGETLEHIIDQLANGSVRHAQRFPFESRARLFLAILQAVRYAHAHGIIHRDLKPSNVMVGPFGEVTVMDWGLAKQIRSARTEAVLQRAALSATLPSAGSSEATESAESVRRKLVQTQHGAVLGTPLYMSPEQAAGRIDALDERSDIYSLSVIFHELLGLKHYLAEKRDLSSVLAAIVGGEVSQAELRQSLMAQGCPAELVHFVEQGMQHNPEQRFQSIDEMVDRLEHNLGGEILAQCHITLFKHIAHRLLKVVDRHPYAFSAALAGGVLVALAGLTFGMWRLVHAFV